MNRRERRNAERAGQTQFLITGEPIAETIEGLVMRLGDNGGGYKPGHAVTVLLRRGVEQGDAGAELRRLAVELEQWAADDK